MKHDMKHVYATVSMSYNILLFAERRGESAQSRYVDSGTLLYHAAAAAIKKSLTYLCIVELCLHIQRLQHLIENRLQAERWRFLTLYLHLAELKIFPCENY